MVVKECLYWTKRNRNPDLSEILISKYKHRTLQFCFTGVLLKARKVRGNMLYKTFCSELEFCTLSENLSPTSACIFRRARFRVFLMKKRNSMEKIFSVFWQLLTEVNLLSILIFCKFGSYHKSSEGFENR